MNFKLNKITKNILSAVLGLITISFIFSIWLGVEESFRIVFGSVYVLFLPGFVLSFAFFKNKEIDAMERGALSFASSIAIVPLLVFYLNLIGMKINFLNTVLTIALIILIGLIVIYKQNKGDKQNKEVSLDKRV